MERENKISNLVLKENKSTGNNFGMNEDYHYPNALAFQWGGC